MMRHSIWKGNGVLGDEEEATGGFRLLANDEQNPGSLILVVFYDFLNAVIALAFRCFVY